MDTRRVKPPGILPYGVANVNGMDVGSSNELWKWRLDCVVKCLQRRFLTVGSMREKEVKLCPPIPSNSQCLESVASSLHDCSCFFVENCHTSNIELEIKEVPPCPVLGNMLPTRPKESPIPPICRHPRSNFAPESAKNVAVPIANTSLDNTLYPPAFVASPRRFAFRSSHRNHFAILHSLLL